MLTKSYILRGGRSQAADFAVADVCLSGGRVVAMAPADAEVVDCRGCLVLPGLVLGHTHLYSALACGMPAWPEAPLDFPDILRLVWWRLDRALDLELCELSAAVGAWLAVRAGVTTLIDHHASPAAIEGSLSAIARGVAAAGARGVLCYELTDRHGRAGALAGLAESDRFLAELSAFPSAGGRTLAGMVGGHAPFTLSDETLRGAAELCSRHGVGFHVHVSEDETDDAAARRTHGKGPLARLDAFGLLGPDTLIGHGVHLRPYERALLAERGCFAAHNPRSNQNNHVGYGDPLTLGPNVVLGTDGIGADLFAEGQAAFYAGRAAHRDFDAGFVQSMLNNGRRLAGRALGEPLLGSLAPGAPADVMVLDDRAPTPVTSGSWPWHWIFTQSASAVRDVFVGGAPRLRDRRPAPELGLDEAALLARAREAALRLFERLAAIPPDARPAPGAP